MSLSYDLCHSFKSELVNLLSETSSALIFMMFNASTVKYKQYDNV